MYKYIYIQTHIYIYVNTCFVIEYVTEKSKQTFWPTLYIIYYIYIYIYIYTHIYIFYICDLEGHTNEYINSFK